MTGLEDLPDDLLSVGLFPLLPIKDVLSLGLAKRGFQALSAAPKLWQQLLVRDHPHAPSFLLDPSTQPLPARHLYIGLRDARAFCPKIEGSDLSDGPLPPGKLLEMHLPAGDEDVDRPRFVEICSSGSHAIGRTSSGDVYLLGTQPDYHRLLTDKRAKSCFASHKLQLPFQVVQMSVIGKRVVMLDKENNVWMVCMPRATTIFRFTHALLDKRIARQIATGSGTVVLTVPGEILHAPPGRGRQLVLQDPYVRPDGKSVKCFSISDAFDVLPPIPLRPLDTASSSSNSQICAIAVDNDLLLALRSNGEVWRWDLNITTDSWSFVPELSSPEVTMIRVVYKCLAVSASPSGPVRSVEWSPNHLTVIGSKTMDLSGKTLVELCITAPQVCALLSNGEVRTWTAMREASGQGHTTCTIDVDSRKVALPGLVYAMSSAGPLSALVLGATPNEVVSQTPLRLRGGANNEKDEAENSAGGTDATADKPAKESRVQHNPEQSHTGGFDSNATIAPGGAIGNHPSPAGVIRSPQFRVGFAGRHATRGREGVSGKEASEVEQK